MSALLRRIQQILMIEKIEYAPAIAEKLHPVRIDAQAQFQQEDRQESDIKRSEF